jgi:hypothetical protein
MSPLQRARLLRRRRRARTRHPNCEPGARCIVHVEREAAAAASLVASMEAGWFHPAPVWSDAGTFDARPWRGLVHCLASGDPCQPNSVAGKRQGRRATTAGSSTSCSASSTSAGLIVSSARTCRGTSTGSSPPSSRHWSEWATALRAEYSQRPKSAPATDASAVPHGRRDDGRNASAERQQRGGQQRLLRDDNGDGAVADASHDHGRRGERGAEAGVWPDETRRRGPASGGACRSMADASDGQISEPGRRPEGRDGPRSAGEALADSSVSRPSERVPDPQGAGEGEGVQRQRRRHPTRDGGTVLADAERARDHKGANSTEHVTTNGTGRMHMDQLPNFVAHGFHPSPPDPATPDGPRSSQERRSLNPLFVEWLMGWPTGLSGFERRKRSCPAGCSSSVGCSLGSSRSGKRR